MKRINLLGAAVILLSSYSETIGQGTLPILEKVISVTFHGEKEDAALSLIAQACGCKFSYNTTLVDAQQSVEGSFQNRSVRFILENIFPGRFQYKARGNYIIITRNPNQTSVKPLTITGYVTDPGGMAISQASIYDKESLTSSISNQFGFFKLTIDKPEVMNRIYVSKELFLDTSFVASKSSDSFYTIRLREESPVKVDTARDDRVEERQQQEGEAAVDLEPELSDSAIVARDLYPDNELSRGQRNIRNIRDTLHRSFQVAFVPFVGSNHKLSGNVINDYSINILGGHSKGTTKLEFGGLFNIDRDDVSYVQVAGIFNNNGGNFKGVQFGGVFNRNKDFDGAAQVAGVANLNRSFANGVQLGGVVNLNERDSRGVQIAGTLNTNWGAFDGFQLAGVINLNRKKSRAPQISGVANLVLDSLSGFQIAGVLNVVTHELRGFQVAGVLNYATRLEGAQVGLINVSDTLTGIPVGLISFVRKGYHKIEVAADEVFYTNIAFRTGVRKFYNILTAGIKPDDSENFWTVGYGFGTARKLSNKLFLNIDFTSNQVNRGSWTQAINLVNKLYLGTDWQFAKKVSLAAGVTWNVYLTRNSFTEYPALFSDYVPKILVDRNYRDVNMKGWIGFKAGLRFL